MEPPQGEDRRRKIEREEEEREREGLPYSAHESRQSGWYDSYEGVTPTDMT
jgi:hypothetical protein